MTVYIEKSEYRAQKARLTRAKNTGDPVAVLAACERVLDEWRAKVWPDDWHRWARAVEDAYLVFLRSDAYADDNDLNDGKVTRRFRRAILNFS